MITEPRLRIRHHLHHWIGLSAGLVVCSAFLLLDPPEGLSVAGWRVAAVGILMAIWWMTEAIPIAATALIPLVLFPLLGIAGERNAAAPYANPLVFLFLGGFLIAIAMERWQLHKRLALNIIRMLGARPNAIIGGFTVAGAFLSMWVSNTATAMMMLPIGLSVVELVRRQDTTRGGNFAVCLMLVIAYSSSIGGMATLIGTPPNAFFSGFMLETYDRSIGFAEWMTLALPLTLIALPLMYLVLTRLIYPVRIREIPGGREFILEQLREMGSMARPEKLVAGVFASAALLWILRPLLEDYVPGLSDPGIAVGMALLLFILPADVRRGEFLLSWRDAERLPWGVLILFGGGLSLAAAIDGTGLAMWLGGKMTLMSDWPLVFIIFAVTAAIVLLTELTSNLATAAAFLPIAASVSVGLGYDPAMLAIPAVLAASCAFMLPVATPPNAIVYGSSFITIPQMARAGVILNILFTVLITLVTYFALPYLM